MLIESQTENAEDADLSKKLKIEPTEETELSDSGECSSNQSRVKNSSTSEGSSHSESPRNLLAVDFESSGCQSSRSSIVQEIYTSYTSTNELSPASDAESDISITNHDERISSKSITDSIRSVSVIEHPLEAMSIPIMEVTSVDESNDLSRKLSTASTSQLHISTANFPIEKRHICEECGKSFPYLSILESHKRCHTGEKPFSCHFCDKKFAQKATLQVHERTHTGERPYKCKYCDKTFAQYGTKTVHEKSAHLGIRNYKCPKCSKCLSSPSALYTHKKTHGDKVFHCEFCPKTFTLKNYLKLHIKQVHEQNERKHVCRFCHKSFAYAGSLQVHVRTHTGERPYLCKYCPKAFASQGNLQSHERTHTGERPFTCGQCGRSFIQKSQLTAHEATHTYIQGASPDSGSSTVSASRKQSEYVCKFCGKRYAYASSLYVHTRLHTGERPFRCTFCDKSFTNQGNMQVHQRVHTGERPYKCDACHKSYAQKVGLKIHQEQCQTYIKNCNANPSRRHSVLTSATSESCQSPTNLSEELDEAMMCMDEKNQPLDASAIHAAALESLRLFNTEFSIPSMLSNTMKPQPLFHASQSQPSSLFSSPISSHRNSLVDTFVPANGNGSMPTDTRYMGLKLPTVAANDLSSHTVTNGTGPNPFSELLLNSLTSTRLQPLIGSTAPSFLSDSSAFHQVSNSNNLYKNTNDHHLDLQLNALRALLELNGTPPQQHQQCAISSLVNHTQQQILQQLLLQSYPFSNGGPLPGLPTSPTTPTTSTMMGLNGLSLNQSQSSMNANVPMSTGGSFANEAAAALTAALQNLASKSEQATMLNL